MVRLSLFVIARAMSLASASGLTFATQGESETRYLLSMNEDGSVKWRWAPAEWEVEYGKGFEEDVDGTFYVKVNGKRFTDTQYDGLLCALDGADGSVKWQRDVGAGPLVGIINDFVYFHGGHYISAIDKTGAVQRTWEGVGNTVVVGPEGSVVAYDDDGRYAEDGLTLNVLAQESGKVKWSFTHKRLNNKFAISEDGGIFATLVRSWKEESEDGGMFDLIYLDGHDGSVAWSVPLTAPKSVDALSLSPQLGSNGVVYLNSADWGKVCNVFALDASGNILRNTPCFVRPDYTFVRWGDHLLVTQPNEDGTLEDVFVYSEKQGNPVFPNVGYAGSSITGYSGTTGNLIWNVSFPGEDFGEPSNGWTSEGEDGTIFASGTRQGGDQEMVVAIRNGVEAWRVDARDFLLVKNGISYFSAGLCDYYNDQDPCVILAVDKDGSQLWTFDLRLDPPTVPAVALV